MAFDLVLHELMVTLQPVPQPVITEIVDDIFLRPRRTLVMISR